MSDTATPPSALKTGGLILAITATGAASLVSFGGSLFRNKLLAVVLHPAGYGEWSQFLTFFNLLQTAAIFGLGTGVTRLIAQRHAGGKPLEPVLTAGAMIAMSAALFLCLVTAALSPWIAEILVNNRHWWWVVALIGLAALPVGLQSIFQAVLYGLEDFRAAGRAGIFTALAGLPLSWLTAWYLGAQGVAIFVIGSYLMSSIFFGWSLRKFVVFRPRLEPGLVKALITAGGAVLSASMLGMLGATIVRSLVLHAAGAAHVGYYQAMSLLTLQALPMLLSGIGAYVVGRAVRDNRVIFSATRLVLLLLIPGLGLGIMLREWFVRILFSAAFAPASVWMPLQFTGDLLLGVSWVWSAVLLAHGRNGMYMAIVFVKTCVFLAITYAGLNMLPSWGPGAPALGYALANGLECLLFSRTPVLRLAVREPDFLRLLVSSATAWMAMTGAAVATPSLWVRAIVCVVVTLGLARFVLTRDERHYAIERVRRRWFKTPASES